MGNLNGPWIIGWVGDTSGCDEYDTIDLESKIEIIFQASQSGSAFTVQRTNSADSPFATIKKIHCGGAVVMQLKENTNLNHITQSGSSPTARLIPNFPLEINITELQSSYIDGNGLYIITTQFKNNFPTYKNENGWMLEKSDSGWMIIHEISNLNFLRNNSISPIVGPYVELNCNSENCQTAIPSTEVDDDGSDDNDDDDNNDTDDLPQIANLKTTEIDTNSFSIEWDGVVNISNYQVQISDSINFTESATFDVNKNQQFFNFNNLSDGFSYYYRIRYENYLGNINGTYSVRNVMTSISGKRAGLDVSLNSEYFPQLTWNLLSDIEYEYSVIIKRSKDAQNWTDIKTFKGSEKITSYVDNNIEDVAVYHYAIVFYNGTDGDFSDTKVISVDKEKPRKPSVQTPKSPTLNKNLHFKWNYDENISHYMYKFNGSSWVKLLQKWTDITITGKEGTNTFHLKSIDTHSNESDESVSVVVIDTTPPPKPIISDMDSMSNKTELKFSWVCNSSDLKEFLYRINRGSWIRIDKSLTSVTLKSIQGQNRFEIKAIDSVGNESDIAEYIVVSDFKPPNPPSLVKIESPTNSPRLFFSWLSEEVVGFRYRVTTWKDSNDTKTVGNWINLSKIRRSVSLVGVDGFYRFELYSYDEFNNNSDVSSQTILVDYSPPQSPELDEIDLIANSSSGQIKIRYSVNIDSDSTGARYRHNNSGWTEYDVNSNPDLEVMLNEGDNIIEIYSYDSVGNESDIRKQHKFIDSIAPSKPEFISPLGGSPDGLFSDLWELCQTNSILEDRAVINISYGYMNEGTLVNFENGSRHPSTSVAPLRTNSTTEFEFKKEIESGFRSFKKIIEDLFDKIEINFIDSGKESNKLKEIPSSPRYGLSKEDFQELDLPNIRIGMVDEYIDIDDSLKNLDTDLFVNSNSIHFDKNLNWKPDNDVDNNSYSIQYGVRYFLGKLLGLPINKENTHGTQHGLVKGLKIANRESSDKNLFSKMYQFPVLGGNDVRVVNSDALDITWKSDTDSLYEYRYALISNTGRITSIERWRELDSQQSKLGRKLIEISEANRLNSTLRFYARSLDESGNTSDESYVDFHLPTEELDTDIDILSVVEICETNSLYKQNANCWDKHGLFSADLRISKSSINGQYIIVEIKDSTEPFARYEKISSGISNGKFSVNSLKSNTNYTFRVCLVTDGINLSNSDTTYPNRVGTMFGKFSNFATLKTPPSYMQIPTAPSIRQIIHYRFKSDENSKFVYPQGESYNLNIWKPACVFKWNASNAQFFKNYEIQYVNSNENENNIKSIIINDQTQLEHIIRLESYNTRYKFRITLNDTIGNTVSSPWQYYSSVPLDVPPELIEEFDVYYAGELKSIYNERPNSKWTLALKLPKVVDKQYLAGHPKDPQRHHVPDVEDFVRKDYELIDWISSIGHPPMRIEFNATGTNSGSKTSYWMTHSKVYDDEFRETDLKIIKQDQGNLVKISGFEEKYKYDFKFTVFDMSGHYIQKSRTIQTKERTTDSTVVSVRPTINVEKYRYINGLDNNGNSLKHIQWILDVKVNVKTEANLKKFYVYFKSSDSKPYTERFEIDISSIPSDRVWSQTTNTLYTVRLSGFQPRTRYYIKVDAVNNFGNLSESSNEYNYVTSVGDKINPERVQLKSIKRSKVGNRDQIQIGLKKSIEPNLDFALMHIVHDTLDERPTSIWKYPNKNYISAGRINAYLANGSYVLNIGMNTDLEKYHTLAMMWRDSSFNYSSSYMKTFNPVSLSQISQLLEDGEVDTSDQDHNVLVLT